MRRSNLPLLAGLVLVLALQLSPAWARVDTLRTFPTRRFAGGVISFSQYLASKLRYPLQAHQAATVGTSVVSFILTPTGALTTIRIVNSLGKAIDAEVVRAIQETSKTWLPADQTESQDSVMLFQPITFHLNDSKFYVEPIKPDFLLEEVGIVGYNSLSNTGFRDDAYCVAELNSAAQKKDYKRMLKMVSELIRRNPYSDQLYLQRANIERELGQTEDACRDYHMIIHFLGKTRLPKQFIQNCPG